MTIRYLFAFVLIALMSSPSTAASDWMRVAFAQHRCFPGYVTITEVPDAQSGRCLESWTRLGRVGGSSLYAGRYEMAADPSDHNSPALVTEVLFESRTKDARIRPLWLTQEFADTYNIQRVQLQRIGRWQIVDVFGCLNGTGGCSQELVLWTPGVGCRKLNDLRPKFEAALPKTYSTLKAPIARLDRMLIEGYGWRPHACNACASLEMTCHLSFDGEDFALARCRRRSLPQ